MLMNDGMIDEEVKRGPNDVMRFIAFHVVDEVVLKHQWHYP